MAIFNSYVKLPEDKPTNIRPGASRLFWVIGSPPFGDGQVGNRETRYIMILIPSGYVKIAIEHV